MRITKGPGDIIRTDRDGIPEEECVRGHAVRGFWFRGEIAYRCQAWVECSCGVATCHEIPDAHCVDCREVVRDEI